MAFQILHQSLENVDRFGRDADHLIGFRTQCCTLGAKCDGRSLFANGVRRSVMLFEWPSPSMGLTTFLTMTRFGVSNGSVALATTRACRATPESPSA